MRNRLPRREASLRNAKKPDRADRSRREALVKPMSNRLTGLLTLTAVVCVAMLLAGSAPAANAARGKRVYEKADCAKCHGPEGRGDGPVGLTLEQIGKSPGNWTDPSTFKLDTDKDGRTGTDRDLRNVIERGALVFGGSQMMGPTKGLSDDDLADLVAFIRSLAAR